MPRLLFPITDFVRGISGPFRGLKYLVANPRLYGYAAIPILLNTLLYGFFAWYTSTRFGRWLDAYLDKPETWYEAAFYYLVATLFAIVLFLAAAYTFTIVGNLILSPFSSFLSDKVEKLYTGQMIDEPFSLKAVMADAVRSLKTEGGRLLFYLVGFLALLLLNLLPIFGTVLYAGAVFVYALFFLGWEFFDFSMERYRMNFQAKKELAIANGFGFIGFGAGAAIFLAVPFLALLLIPACVVGATLVFCDLNLAGRVPSNPSVPATNPETEP